MCLMNEYDPEQILPYQKRNGLNVVKSRFNGPWDLTVHWDLAEFNAGVSRPFYTFLMKLT